MRGMKPLLALLALLALPLLSACNQPKEEDCRKAIANIDRIAGRTADPAEEAAAVRKCRGSASKKAVQCWIAAQTQDDLERCEGPARTPKVPPAPPAQKK